MCREKKASVCISISSMTANTQKCIIDEITVDWMAQCGRLKIKVNTSKTDNMHLQTVSL